MKADHLDAVAAYNAETIALISEAEDYAQRMQEAYDRAAERAKEAKEILQAAIGSIRATFRERRYGLAELQRGQKLLPFAAAPDGKAEINAAFSTRPATRELNEVSAAVPMDELDISVHVADLLADGGIRTLGDLWTWILDGRRLGEVPGITPARAKEIGEAVDAYWQSIENAEAEAAHTIAEEITDDSLRAHAKAAINASFAANPGQADTPGPAMGSGIPKAPGTPLTPPAAKPKRSRKAKGEPTAAAIAEAARGALAKAKAKAEAQPS